MTLFSQGKVRVYDNMTLIKNKTKKIFWWCLFPDCDQIYSSTFKIILLVCLKTEKSNWDMDWHKWEEAKMNSGTYVQGFISKIL